MISEKKCPEGKMRNPATGRCINIPKEKTVKKNPSPQPNNTNNPKNKTTKVKSCPEGKILNPVTGRCINIPKEKPVKNPSPQSNNPKNKTTKVKSCPEGKILNPVTGRCINIPKEKPVKNKSVKNPTPKTTKVKSPTPYPSPIKEKSPSPYPSPIKEKSPTPKSTKEKSPSPYPSPIKEKSPTPKSTKEKSPTPYPSPIKEKSPTHYPSPIKEKSPTPKSTKVKSPSPSPTPQYEEDVIPEDIIKDWLKKHMSVIGHSQGAVYAYSFGNQAAETIVYNPAPYNGKKPKNTFILRRDGDIISFFTNANYNDEDKVYYIKLEPKKGIGAHTTVGLKHDFTIYGYLDKDLLSDDIEEVTILQEKQSGGGFTGNQLYRLMGSQYKRREVAGDDSTIVKPEQAINVKPLDVNNKDLFNDKFQAYVDLDNARIIVIHRGTDATSINDIGNNIRNLFITKQGNHLSKTYRYETAENGHNELIRYLMNIKHNKPDVKKVIIKSILTMLKHNYADSDTESRDISPINVKSP